MSKLKQKNNISPFLFSKIKIDNKFCNFYYILLYLKKTL